MSLRAACGKLLKLPYTGAIIDCMYLMDDMDRADTSLYTTKEDLLAFLLGFQSLTTLPNYTVPVFCGFGQVEEFREVMLGHFRGGVERHFWVKQDVDPSVFKDRATNCLETFLIGF